MPLQHRVSGQNVDLDDQKKQAIRDGIGASAADHSHAGLMTPAERNKLGSLPVNPLADLVDMRAALDAAPEAERAGFQAAMSGDVLAVSASRSLTAIDDGGRLHCAAGITLTVPAGLGPKFGCAIYGSVTISAGANVTIADRRVSGAVNPVCAIEPTPNVESYLLIGSRA